MFWSYKFIWALIRSTLCKAIRIYIFFLVKECFPFHPTRKYCSFLWRSDLLFLVWSDIHSALLCIVGGGYLCLLDTVVIFDCIYKGITRCSPAVQGKYASCRIRVSVDRWLKKPNEADIWSGKPLHQCDYRGLLFKRSLNII